MEVLAAVGTIVGLVGAAVAAVRTAHSYIHPMMEFRSELAVLTAETTSLLGLLATVKAILEPLAKEVEQNPAKESQIVDGLQPTHVFRELRKEKLHSCQMALDQVLDILKKCQPTESGKISIIDEGKNFQKRMAYPIRKDEIHEALGALERHKSSFALALLIHGT